MGKAAVGQSSATAGAADADRTGASVPGDRAPCRDDAAQATASVVSAIAEEAARHWVLMTD